MQKGKIKMFQKHKGQQSICCFSPPFTFSINNHQDIFSITMAIQGMPLFSLHDLTDLITQDESNYSSKSAFDKWKITTTPKIKCQSIINKSMQEDINKEMYS